MDDKMQNQDNLDVKKAVVTGKLQQRDDDRLSDLKKRKDEKDSKAARNETSVYFDETFKNSVSEIEKGLEQSGTMSKGMTNPATKTELTAHFDALLIAVQKCQKFLSDSTMFLTAYEVQKSQDTVTKLQSAIQEKRNELLPKKKFAFKSKKKADKVEEDSKQQDKEKAKKPTNFAARDNLFSDDASKTLTSNANAINQKDISLARLRDCTVKLYGSPSALHINNLENCKIFCGPTSGSIFIDDCRNCVFVIPCQQLRIHSTNETQFYIHVTSRAIIEDCHNVEFAPYNWHYGDIEEHYTLSGLDKSRNSWNDVDDFNWLASDAHSPNWTVLPESKRVEKWDC